ncbi:MAG: TldD/PmbA family protein, partial [Chloroflexi bacterium]|nr:TldD/PmbA family protein [Chloroflexota bacterium]
MLGQEELKKLADRALEMSQADQTEIVVVAPHSALTRFANNYIHQNVEQQDLDIRVRSIIGKKIGVASSNDTSDDGLKNVVDRALNLARHQRENTDFHSLPSPRPIKEADAYVERTARTGPEERAAVVAQICDAASRAGLTAAGAFRTASTEIAVANSLGTFAYQRDTLADVNTVVMSEHGSGHAERVSPDVADIDGEAIAKEAVDTALRNINQTELKPGDYDVVFQEYAVADILDFFAYLAFGAQAYQEKRSFMAGRIGEQVMGENITLYDDGLSLEGSPNPFDFEGVPRQPVTFVENGIAKGVVWDTYTAGKDQDDRETTGHALPAGSTFGPVPSNMFLTTGDATIEEMVESTKRGVYVSRFWYTRPVHPLNVVVTGMTRDGTFLIEDGKITSPIKNLRFTQSYLEAMNRVEAIGKDSMLHQAIAGVSRVPALKIAKWS